MAAFSIIKNYKRLRKENNNVDAKRMRNIQGIRFYNMVCVILAHTVMLGYHVPVLNPKFNEKVSRAEAEGQKYELKKYFSDHR